MGGSDRGCFESYKEYPLYHSFDLKMKGERKGWHLWYPGPHYTTHYDTTELPFYYISFTFENEKLTWKESRHQVHPQSRRECVSPYKCFHENRHQSTIKLKRSDLGLFYKTVKRLQWKVYTIWTQIHKTLVYVIPIFYYRSGRVQSFRLHIRGYYGLVGVTDMKVYSCPFFIWWNTSKLRILVGPTGFFSVGNRRRIFFFFS